MSQTTAAGATPDAPVPPGQRLVAMDGLRGLAVIMIFWVNLKGMMVPQIFVYHPMRWESGIDQAIGYLQIFLVDDKWRSLFACLFGAGLVLIADKTAAAGGRPRVRLAIRLFWLWLFGFAHEILLWSGDILLDYATIGFMALPFVRLKARGLWIAFAVAFVVGGIWTVASELWSLQIPFAREEMTNVFWDPSDGFIAAQAEARLAPWTEQVAGRWGEFAFGFFFILLVLGVFWEFLTAALGGMALWRSGFFAGRWSRRGYLTAAALALGLSVVTDVVRLWVVAHFDSLDGFRYGEIINVLNGFAGGFGWASLFMAVFAHRAPGPLAAAGRMAFTNYILCTVIGMGLASSWGLGQFWQLSHLQITGVWLATGLAMVLWSSLWLSVFRFGPLEWLWRSLTYGRPAAVFRSGR